MRAVGNLIPAVAERSGYRCEAVWSPGYRCPNRADAIHHRLPRSRARVGDEHLLDAAGDAENLAHLCTPCHEAAHANPTRARAAYLSGPWGSMVVLREGITISGSVAALGDGSIRYVGLSDEYRERYP